LNIAVLSFLLGFDIGPGRTYIWRRKPDVVNVALDLVYGGAGGKSNLNGIKKGFPSMVFIDFGQNLLRVDDSFGIQKSYNENEEVELHFFFLLIQPKTINVTALPDYYYNMKSMSNWQ
jgi:hypothetical protein